MKLASIICSFFALGIFTSAFVARADCLTPPSGLIGWWPGEGNANDVINGNNGNAVNTTYTNGIVGAAFSFDPEIYGWTGVQIADQPAYALTNALTIEGWIRVRGDGYLIFWRCDNRPGTDPYFLSMNGNNQLNFGISDENNDYTSVQVAIPYYQWLHVAATFDGSTGTLSLYTNGVLAAQTVTDIVPFGALVQDDSPGVCIGNLNDGQNDFPFVGDIDEISLYNRALSADEILSLYNAGSAGKCDGPFPPFIETQPAGQTVVEGNSVAFSVSAGGTPPLSYQWTFNNSNIPGATNSFLCLTNVHPSQAGNYAVKVASILGNVTSSNAVLAVISQNILVYNYSGGEKVTTLGLETSFKYYGEMFFIPDNTNGVFVGWATINNRKQYWVHPFSDYLLMTVPGDKNTYTVLGKVGEDFDSNGHPEIWSYLHKGQNTSLLIGTNKHYFFPNTFAGSA